MQNDQSPWPGALMFIATLVFIAFVIWVVWG